MHNRQHDHLGFILVWLLKGRTIWECGPYKYFFTGVHSIVSEPKATQVTNWIPLSLHIVWILVHLISCLATSVLFSFFFVRKWNQFFFATFGMDLFFSLNFYFKKNFVLVSTYFHLIIVFFLLFILLFYYCMIVWIGTRSHWMI